MSNGSGEDESDDEELKLDEEYADEDLLTSNRYLTVEELVELAR